MKDVEMQAIFPFSQTSSDKVTFSELLTSEEIWNQSNEKLSG